MFEGEERWSRNCGSGIGLSNYKNVYRDNILCGNWQEELYGNRILRDATADPQPPDQYLSVTTSDFDRKPIDPERQRGGCNVEGMSYEQLFGHGEELYGETKASNAEASVSEVHFNKPDWEKRKAHEMLWMGDKANDLTMPAITGSRRGLLDEKKAQWHEEVTKDVHGTSVTSENFRDPKEQPVMHFTSAPRRPRANYLGRTLAAPHVSMGLRK